MSESRLVPSADNCGTPDKTRKNRPYERFRSHRLLDAARAITVRERQKGCRLWVQGLAEIVSVVRSVGRDGRTVASTRGLQTCGHHTCPRCGPIMARAEAERLERLYSAHIERGGMLLTGVLTLSHGPFDKLGDLMAAQDGARRAAMQGAAWRKAKRRTGVAGYTWHRECTHGKNGWHPHIHVVLLLQHDVTDEQAQALWDALVRPYRARLDRQGIRTADACNDWQRVRDHERMAQYLAGEMALGQSKEGKGRTLFAVLDEFEQTGDMRLAGLYNEFERAMDGRRWRTWSRGLAARYGVQGGSEAADEAAAEAEDADDAIGSTEAETVLEMDSGTWRALARRVGAVVALLTLVEDRQDVQARAMVAVVQRALAGADEPPASTVEPVCGTGPFS